MSVADRVTMIRLIENEVDLSEYFDFQDIGYKNIFIQLINTYYTEEKCIELLRRYIG